MLRVSLQALGGGIVDAVHGRVHKRIKEYILRSKSYGDDQV